MVTGNPTLSESAFRQYGGFAHAGTADAMTVQGTVNKCGVLLLCVLVTSLLSWNAPPQLQTLLMIVGLIGGLIAALVTVFKQTWAPVTGPIYALLEGLLLGGLSAILEAQYSGVVIQAVALTFGILLAVLMAYKTGLIRATEKFKAGVVVATGGIFLVYMMTLVLGLFGVQVPFIHQAGPIGIGFSVFVVIIAALNFVLDFDFIETKAAEGAPKFVEWYAAFGVMVTLVWLYIEALRLLVKIRSYMGK